MCPVPVWCHASGVHVAVIQPISDSNMTYSTHDIQAPCAPARTENAHAPIPDAKSMLVAGDWAKLTNNTYVI